MVRPTRANRPGLATALLDAPAHRRAAGEPLLEPRRVRRGLPPRSTRSVAAHDRTGKGGDEGGARVGHGPEARRVYREALAHANSQSQAERVSELTSRCLAVLDAWELDRAAFTREVKDTRNWLNHWGKRGAATRDDGAGLSLLVARLEVILYANLMLDLGMSDLEVATAIGSGWRLGLARGEPSHLGLVGAHSTVKIR